MAARPPVTERGGGGRDGRRPADAVRGRAREGRHTGGAGPRACAAPGVDLALRSTLGPHPVLLELLAARIAAVSGPGAPAPSSSSAAAPLPSCLEQSNLPS